MLLPIRIGSDQLFDFKTTANYEFSHRIELRADLIKLSISTMLIEMIICLS